MSSVTEDILTTMVELKSEGDSKCSLKATSHTRAMEPFDFMISLVIGLPCDVVFDRYTFRLRMYFWNFKLLHSMLLSLTSNTSLSLLFKSNSSL